METQGQSRATSSGPSAGLWAGERPQKSTSCNISLGISLGLSKNPTELSLRDGTWPQSPSWGLLPARGQWEGDAGSFEAWLLLRCWGRTWSDHPSAPRMAQGRANTLVSPFALPAAPARTPAIPPCRQGKKTTSVSQRRRGSLPHFRRKLSVWYPGCDTDLRGRGTHESDSEVVKLPPAKSTVTPATPAGCITA